MNKFVGIGNVVKEPEMYTTNSGVKVAKITLAINRRFANAQGNREADFLTCVAWRNTAEYVEKYVHKGKKLAVSGSVQTRSYDTQDGQKRFVTEIQVDEIEIVSKKEDGEKEDEKADTKAEKVFGKENVEMVENDDEELPF